MDSRNRKIIVLAIVLLIAGAMVASFGRSLFALNNTRSSVPIPAPPKTPPPAPSLPQSSINRWQSTRKRPPPWWPLWPGRIATTGI